MRSCGMGWRGLNAHVAMAMIALLCCAVSVRAESPKTATDRMPALIEQFSADREALAAAYTVRVSAGAPGADEEVPKR